MIHTTEYYDEFLRYHDLAKTQQDKCNLGMEPYIGSVQDDLMQNVELYDVVDRKYAGFSQIVHDIWYGWNKDHPYWSKMEAGKVTYDREVIAKDWTGKSIGLPEFLYILILHRVTGSGINYAYNPSGYYNSILRHMHQCYDEKNGVKIITLAKMVDFVKNYRSSFMTSVGYQFPQFPKPIDGYKLGGVYYLCEFLPKLSRDMAEYMIQKKQLTFRELGTWMLNWNVEHGLARYAFQYAAVLADVADWLPQYIDRSSPFYYGTNAVKCVSLMGTSKSLKGQDLLDGIMEKASKDTGGLAYNLEDVMCDTIRFLENYVKPGADYNHLDLDKVWNSSKLIHPHGRQKAMLDLGLVKTFNGIKFHPRGDYVIKDAGLTEQQYIEKVRSLQNA